MKSGFLAAFVLSSLSLEAAVIRTTAGGSVRVPIPGATAAYSVDTDCADVAIYPGGLVVTGRRACITHVVAVLPDSVVDLNVEIRSRPQEAEQLRTAQKMARNTQEFGSLSTSFASDRSELETTINVARSEGAGSTKMSMSYLNGYGYYGNVRRSAVPSASIQIDTPGLRLGLFDRHVNDSPLTLNGIAVRGVHLDKGSWYGHAGVVSFSGFRERLLDSSPDSVAQIGHRTQIDARSTLTLALQGVRTSNRYWSGRSGVIGSAQYEYVIPQRLNFAGQLGLSRGIGSAVVADYTNTSTAINIRARSMPVNFAVLSNTRGPGFAGSGSITRRLNGIFSVEAFGSRESYSVPNRPNQTMQSLGTRLQWRPAQTLRASAGASLTTISGMSRNYRSVSLPLSLSRDWRHVSNTFQYDFRNSELYGGSHSFRDSIRWSFRSLTLTGVVQRQTQAPTLEYVLGEVPALREALLAAGVVVTSPEQLLEFLNENADLLAGGTLRDLTLNIAPVRREFAATAQWTPLRQLSGRIEWRNSSEQRVAGPRSFTMVTARTTLKVTRQTDISAGITLTNATVGARAGTRGNALTVGIRRQFYSVPPGVVPVFGGGTIRGTVFLDDRDRNRKEGLKIPGATIILDGVRRTRTDKDGRYSFRGVSAGKHSVAVALGDSMRYTPTTPANVVVEHDGTADFGFSLLTSTIFGSVRNDAGRSLANVVLLISGRADLKTTADGSGKFLLNELHVGTYTVTLDTDSLPPGYDLASVEPITISIEPGRPGRVEMEVRAMRSLSGRITCSGTTAAGAVVTLASPEQDPRAVAMDDAGNFLLRDLRSGSHVLEIVRGNLKHMKVLEIGAEPATERDHNIDICMPSAAPEHDAKP